MANDKSFKIKNGILAQRYLQTGGNETAGSVGYILSEAVYDSVSFSVVAQDTSPQSMFFKPDGFRMYVLGNTGDAVNEYNLSTAWDISTSVFSQSFSVASQDTSPRGLFFKPDGLKMYVVGLSGRVYEYNLSFAWDVSSAGISQNFSVSAQDVSPVSVFFKVDGLKMYIVGDDDGEINEYNLSTAWDISTSVFSQFLSVSGQDSTPRGLFFKPDGAKMYLAGISGNSVYEYNLSTPWDVSTATVNFSFNVSAQITNAQGVFFKVDGLKMYVLTANQDAIYQYSTASLTQTLDLSTGTYFSFTPSGATTVFFTNPPASGLALGFAVEVVGDGSAITWPASIKWHEATTPTATATKEIYVFITTDGGTTYYGKKAAEGLSS